LDITADNAEQWRAGARDSGIEVAQETTRAIP